jgi:acetate kinase
MRHVLVLNAGSSSLKWVVLDADSETVVVDGLASWHTSHDDRHAQELVAAFEQIPTSVNAVGHRVVHGGSRFQQPLLIDAAVRQGIAELTELAPLHNPAALAGIDAATERLPGVPHVAAFDTAFHATIPEPAALYALPSNWSERWQIRRFGFHGLSVEYAVARATELLGSLPGRLIVCHLGAGCSVTALRDGRSVDTSMGFTPLDGVMMARRSGAVDPGVLLHLLEDQRLTLNQLAHGLNEEAGLLGVSGVSADLREVLAAEETGHARARLAVSMFVYRLVACVGAMTASLGGVDALLFTGGIGEHSSLIRQRVLDGLAFLGIRIDRERDRAIASDADVALPDSSVRVLVVTAREDLSILRAVKRVLDWP